MKPMASSGHVAEVLRLHLGGVSVRRIASHLQLARQTVRKLLDEHSAPAKPMVERDSRLDPYEKATPTLVGDSPEMRAPVEST